MNSNALLALLVDLYQQVVTLTAENTELRKIVAERDDSTPVPPAV